MGFISVEVDVDVDDVIDQISDSRLLEEVAERGVRNKQDPDARAVVSRAIAIIRTGRVADGVTILEREFFPTWKSKADCEAAYQLAMALKAA
jgi:hypothetical protein